MGGVYAYWLDSDDIKHQSVTIDEIRQACETGEADLISFYGSVGPKPHADFQYDIKKDILNIEVTSKDQEVVEDVIDFAKKTFPNNVSQK